MASSGKAKIAIVGSGLIGRSWAMLFVSAGYKVTLYDVIPSQLETALGDIKRQMEKLEASGSLKGTLSAQDQFSLISITNNLKDCLAGAIHIQECVPERLELKQTIFQELDHLATEDQVLSSSTSTLPASKFTENLHHRSQCIVSHPVNPPYHMPLVELVPAPWTKPEVLKNTRALMEDIGQSPVTLNKEVLGFVQPRIQYALIKEAVKLLIDDVISVEDLDKVMTEGLGLLYSFCGTLEVTHLNAEGYENYIERYGEMQKKMAADLGPDVELVNNPDLETVHRQLEGITPLDQLAAKRRWRDESIAALSKLRNDMNRKNKDSGSSS